MSWVVLRTRSAATMGEANVRNDESNERRRSYSFYDYGYPKNTLTSEVVAMIMAL